MAAIRPKTFDQFRGQPQATEVLRTAVHAAKARRQIMRHVLLDGPAGLGKTSLGASVLPTELGVKCTYLNCAGISKPGELVAQLTTLDPGQVLFLDEVHALVASARDHLLSVLEDFKVTVNIGDSVKPELMTLKMPEVTIVAATTRQGMLSEPMRDRFGIKATLRPYTDPDMVGVLGWTAEARGAALEDAAVSRLVAPCHGTARKAVSFIEACLDTQAVAGGTGRPITEADVQATLDRLGYRGALDAQEFEYLDILSTAVRPMGLTALASRLQEDTKTIEDVIEPWLFRQGYVARLPQGRQITEDGRTILQSLRNPA